jgi:hypothetical protein
MPEAMNYANLSRQELERRLAAAERFCVVFGWTAAARDSDRDRAAHELWADWVRVSGHPLSPRANPDLDAMVPTLAAMREATISATLQRIHDEDVGNG